jgi:small subunit ribosomal protein S7
MPRRGKISKRDIIPDPKYNDKIVAKFMSYMMRGGKKGLAEKILYDALDIVGEKTKEDPLKQFKKAVDNIKPMIEVKSRRVGGATYQVPIEVRPDRKLALALRWLVIYSKQRSEKTMVEKISGELLDALNNKGGAIKKKEEVHKMAANKAFAHYRW